MTPQLMQAIKLLQLSNLDLVAYVDAELERNPLLERRDGRRRRANLSPKLPRIRTRAPPTGPTGTVAIWKPAARQLRNGSIPTSATSSRATKARRLSVRRPQKRPPMRSGPARSRGARTATTISRPLSSPRRRLSGHLNEQACSRNSRSQTPADRQLSDRYRSTRRAISRRSCRRLRKSSARRSRKSKLCLTVLQTFSPTGVCARNLRECLTIQLKERNRFDPAMRALVGAPRTAGEARVRGAEETLRRGRRRLSPT